MPADSLLAMTSRAAGRLAPAITSVGELPAKLVLPVLAKITSPAQLHEVELASPHIVGKIDDLWLAFLKRDVPGYESRPHLPSNPASWYKVYTKLKKEADAEADAGRDALKAAMQGIKKTKEAKVATFIDKGEDLPEGPPGVRRRRKGPYDYEGDKISSNGVRKPNVFDKIRQEKKKAQVARRNRASMPVEELQARVTARHPAFTTNRTQNIIEERKRLDAEKLKQREIAAAAVLTEKVRIRKAAAVAQVSGSQDEAGYHLLADREARLKAMKSGQPLAGRKRSADEAALTIDDLEGPFDHNSQASQDGDDEWLFGDNPSAAKHKLSPTPQIKKAKVQHDAPTTGTSVAKTPSPSPSSPPPPSSGLPRRPSISPDRVPSNPAAKSVTKKRARHSLFCKRS